MDYIAALAKEKEDAVKAAEDSGLSTRAFGVYWSLKDDEALAKAGISGVELAKEAETLLARFPNAQVNADEQRRLRAALYRPLLGLDKEERGRIVEAVLPFFSTADLMMRTRDNGRDAASCETGSILVTAFEGRSRG